MSECAKEKGESSMTTWRVPKEKWQSYMDAVSRELTGKQVEIEVDSLDLGHQVEADWVPLYGITYDDKDDLVAIEIEGLTHTVNRPQDVFADRDETGLKRMEIVGADGRQQILNFRDPLMLEGPEG